ncbi:MAG: agmatine deiminase family protein, partial [Flavobacteriales bacterium]|nr:agmatine deiminase family protein [Flavobacteriales bacterium]
LGKDFAVLTRKVFRENPHRRRNQVEKELRELLQVVRLVWIPEDPHDFTGHADGLVAVLDGNTVLVPDLSRTDPALG